MPLPKIATPTYELVLPSTGKKIKYRPFLVKEEKVLVLALESEDVTQITNAIKAILKDCISTRIKIDTLPTFDIEYLFLNIRAKSVGEALDLVVTCPDDNETTVPVKVFIDEIEVLQDEDHSTDISLDGNLTLRMKYPSLEQFIENNFEYGATEVSQIEQSFDVIASCIDMVFDREDSWAASDCTKKELLEWLESLNSSQFKEVEKFFETMPKLSHTFKVTNPNTKVESEVTLEGLSSFFD
jgi:molecular chaperone DnaK (HSP70)